MRFVDYINTDRGIFDYFYLLCRSIKKIIFITANSFVDQRRTWEIPHLSGISMDIGHSSIDHRTKKNVDCVSLWKYIDCVAKHINVLFNSSNRMNRGIPYRAVYVLIIASICAIRNCFQFFHSDMNTCHSWMMLCG